MKRNEKVSKIMSTELITVNTTASFSEIRAKFTEGGFHHLPVVTGEQLVGIISFTDILRFSFGDAFGSDSRTVDATLDHSVSIEQIMRSKPKTITPEDSVRTAAELLANGEYHSLPVVENEKLVGLITTTDLICYLIEQY